MTQPRLAMTVDMSQQRPVVTAVGEIDMANVDEFEESMAHAATGASAITVDVSGIRYCDSAAIRALFAIAATTALNLVVSQTGPIKTLLNITGLAHIATVDMAQPESGIPRSS